MLDRTPSQRRLLLTVIVPVFNEADVIPMFFSRIQPVIAKIFTQ
jgi:hypothetical protein